MKAKEAMEEKEALDSMATDLASRNEQLKTALEACKTLQARLGLAEQVATALEAILGTPENVWPFGLTDPFIDALKIGRSAISAWRNGASDHPAPAQLASDVQLIEAFRDEAVVSGHYNTQGSDYAALAAQAIGKRQALEDELLRRLCAGAAVRAELENVRQALFEHAGIEDQGDTLAPHVARLAGYASKYVQSAVNDRKLRKQAEQERDEFRAELSRLLEAHQALAAEYEALLADVEAGDGDDSQPFAVPIAREFTSKTRLTDFPWFRAMEARAAQNGDAAVTILAESADEKGS